MMTPIPPITIVSSANSFGGNSSLEILGDSAMDSVEDVIELSWLRQCIDLVPGFGVLIASRNNGRYLS